MALWLVTDLPRVFSIPVRTYLPRGMMGKMECPTEANPPVSLILWAKNERIIDLTQMTRLKANKEGALVIKTVITTDEGTYTCTPYSPLGFGQVSTPIQVLVRGTSSSSQVENILTNQFYIISLLANLASCNLASSNLI